MIMFADSLKSQIGNTVLLHTIDRKTFIAKIKSIDGNLLICDMGDEQDQHINLDLIFRWNLMAEKG
jgi:ribosome maturation factor RimP